LMQESDDAAMLAAVPVYRKFPRKSRPTTKSARDRPDRNSQKCGVLSSSLLKPHICDMPDSNSEERLVKLEFLVTHLEHELATMNSVVLEQQKQIDALKRTAARLDDRMARLAEDEERRDPGEERPPHY
jgi:SlyX protein